MVCDMKFKIKLIVAIIAGYIALFAISFNFGTLYYAKHNIKEPDKSVFKVVTEPPNDYKDEIIIYDALHRMSNGKISSESKDKSGILEINKLNIDAIRRISIRMDYIDKDYILETLSRWEKNDFSLIVSEHDYFFIKLNNIIKS
jgi:hypothetical protein